jgi:hypothetical protein
MYPSLSSIGKAAPGGGGGGDAYGGGGAGAASGSGAPRAAGGAPLQSAPSAEASPWSLDSPAVLRVKIADEYRLDPLVRRGGSGRRGAGSGGAARRGAARAAQAHARQRRAAAPPPRGSESESGRSRASQPRRAVRSPRGCARNGDPKPDPPPPAARRPAAQVQVPPALEASSRPQQRDFDFDYERTVMQQEGGGLVERFLGKPEVRGGGGHGGHALPWAACSGGHGLPRRTCWRPCACGAGAAPCLRLPFRNARPPPTPPPPPPTPQDTYYSGSKVGKYVAMGYSVPAVHLALAYQASTRGDEAQVRPRAARRRSYRAGSRDPAGRPPRLARATHTPRLPGAAGPLLQPYAMHPNLSPVASFNPPSNPPPGGGFLQQLHAADRDGLQRGGRGGRARARQERRNRGRRPVPRDDGLTAAPRLQLLLACMLTLSVPRPSFDRAAPNICFGGRHAATLAPNPGAACKIAAAAALAGRCGAPGAAAAGPSLQKAWHGEGGAGERAWRPRAPPAPAPPPPHPHPAPLVPTGHRARRADRHGTPRGRRPTPPRTRARARSAGARRPPWLPRLAPRAALIPPARAPPPPTPPDPTANTGRPAPSAGRHTPQSPRSSAMLSAAQRLSSGAASAAKAQVGVCCVRLDPPGRGGPIGADPPGGRSVIPRARPRSGRIALPGPGLQPASPPRPNGRGPGPPGGRRDRGRETPRARRGRVIRRPARHGRARGRPAGRGRRRGPARGARGAGQRAAPGRVRARARLRAGGAAAAPRAPPPRFAGRGAAPRAPPGNALPPVHIATQEPPSRCAALTPAAPPLCSSLPPPPAPGRARARRRALRLPRAPRCHGRARAGEWQPHHEWPHQRGPQRRHRARRDRQGRQARRPQQGPVDALRQVWRDPLHQAPQGAPPHLLRLQLPPQDDE